MKNQQELQEELIIAIAEAAGWTDCRLVIKGAGGGTVYPTAHGKPPNRKYEAPCPRYTADLNAMHQAEKSLSNDQWWVFVEHLTNICGGGIVLCISATALQRATAFKETLS